MEIEAAIEIVRNEDRHLVLAMMGHSTGGLIASYYVHRGRRKSEVNALVLNSPFFAFSMPSIRRYLLPLAGALGAVVPWARDPVGISPHYGQSLHSAHHGEWNYDLRWKPIEGFPVYYGWVRAIRKVQAVLAGDISLELPVLVLHSARSVAARGAWNEDFMRADIVLDVNDMSRVGKKLGSNVTVVSIDGGVHDIFLSSPEVRNAAIELTVEWLDLQPFVREPSAVRGGDRVNDTHRGAKS